MPPPAPRTATFLHSMTAVDLPARMRPADVDADNTQRLDAMFPHAFRPLKEGVLASMLTLIDEWTLYTAEVTVATMMPLIL